MKKLFVIVFSLISIGSYCQDTINIDNNPYAVKIVQMDDDFLYYQTVVSPELKKIAISKVTSYTLSDKGKFIIDKRTGMRINTAYMETNTNNPENNYFLNNQNKDSVNYQIGYLRYNLSKFQREIVPGICISATGILTALTAPYLIKVPEDYTEFTKYSNKVKAVTFIGSGICLVGTIICIDSFKWIKRASIEPTMYGMKLNVKF